MSACTLIYPHQLFDPHPAVTRGRPVVFVEDGLFFGDPHVGIKFHRQKIILHRASMKTYAARLEQRGHEVIYLEHEDGRATGDFLAELRERGYDSFHLCDEADYLLRRRLDRFGDGESVEIVRVDSPMFVTPREVLDEEFSGDRRAGMARFYQGQRKRLEVLLNKDGSPRGGKWSFDEENRKPYPAKGLDLPPEPSSRETKYVAEARERVEARYPDCFGSAEAFSYPVSHAAAGTWLEKFFEERFALFGDYEDAISRDERVLYHGVLTPMLNIGLLTPDDVLRKALAFADENEVPLNSLEGFVRQLIGWREFMFGAYEHLGVKCRTSNFWEFEDRKIPDSFYDGTTGIEPVDEVIRRVLDHGWCHHIERLMIMGNFMLLCRIHPQRVYDWFMELFVDAYDWVMVPNVYGMSQFADGGLFTTKPYLSGSNYVRKMSDFPKGEWCAVWDGLFWSFIADYRDVFASQHRLGMMVKQLERMSAEKLADHRENAESFLGELGLPLT